MRVEHTGACVVGSHIGRVRREIALRLGLVGTAALAGFGLGGCGKSSGATATESTAAASTESGGQTLLFLADIRHGPSAGLSLLGILDLKLGRGGELTGSVRYRGERVLVSGSAEGRVLTLRLLLPGGGRISGVGRSSGEIRSIADIPNSGTLVGPEPGDRGDWDLGSANHPHTWSQEGT